MAASPKWKVYDHRKVYQAVLDNLRDEAGDAYRESYRVCCLPGKVKASDAALHEANEKAMKAFGRMASLVRDAIHS